MITYSQRNMDWSAVKLGSTVWTMGDSGCYVTTIAQILTLAGWNITPGDVVAKLNAIGGFNANGEAKWASVMQAFPQFHYGGSPYAILQLRKKVTRADGSVFYEYHYEAKGADGTIYDPWTASTAPPVGYVLTGASEGIGCDPAPAPVIVADAPSQPRTPFKVITVKALNVRSQPKVDSQDILPGLFLGKGSVVTIDGYVNPSDGWYDVYDEAGNNIGKSNQWCLSDLHKAYFAAAYVKEIQPTNNA
jgi:hypothetical protein